MATNQIGTLNEKSLHAVLKAWYARPDDLFEVPIENFVIDLVRGDLLIEIQTRGFSAIKAKLTKLVPHHPVRLVYPIAHEKWIVKSAADGNRPINRRKSPKRGTIEDLFIELVSFPRLLADPNFSLEVLLIQEEEHRRHRANRRWRSKQWITHERQLVRVLDRQLFESPADMIALLPTQLPEPFTTADIAKVIAKPRRVAQKMAYCLREMGAIDTVGKQGNALLYARSSFGDLFPSSRRSMCPEDLHLIT